MIRAAECTGTELLIRMSSADLSFVWKVFDTGVRNVLVPRVRTAETARRVVRAGRFSYEDGPGARGLGKGRSSSYGSSYGTDRMSIAGGKTKTCSRASSSNVTRPPRTLTR